MQSHRPVVPRREFLARAGAATVSAGLVAPAALSALVATADAQPATPATPAEGQGARPIPVGFLGTGYSHFREKHRLISSSLDWRLVGLCDADAEARARGPANARWMSEAELFAEADVVIVESAVQHHAADARRALEAGRHVHVEKPPADTVEALRDLLRIAGERKRLLQVGYMWRHNPGFNAALEAARQGWLGDVYLFRATMNTQAGPEQRREWARFPGGALFEQGCHLIDPMVRLLGRPTKVTPFLQRREIGAGDDLADNCVAVFEFPRALGVISSAPLQPNAGPQRFLEILGTQGTARVQPIEPPSLHLDLARAAGPYPKGGSSPALPAFQRYVDEFAALARAIRTGQPLAVSPDTELAIQEALVAACTPKPSR